MKGLRENGIAISPEGFGLKHQWGSRGIANPSRKTFVCPKCQTRVSVCTPAKPIIAGVKEEAKAVETFECPVCGTQLSSTSLKERLERIKQLSNVSISEKEEPVKFAQASIKQMEKKGTIGALGRQLKIPEGKDITDVYSPEELVSKVYEPGRVRTRRRILWAAALNKNRSPFWAKVLSLIKKVTKKEKREEETK